MYFPVSYLLRWAGAFVFTQLVEVPLYRRWFDCSAPFAFGASAIAHPFIWFVILPYGPRDNLVRALLAELLAWLVEAAYFRARVSWRRAVVGALLANAASLSLGFLSQRLFGVP